MPKQALVICADVMEQIGILVPITAEIFGAAHAVLLATGMPALCFISAALPSRYPRRISLPIRAGLIRLHCVRQITPVFSVVEVFLPMSRWATHPFPVRTQVS